MDPKATAGSTHPFRSEEHARAAAAACDFLASCPEVDAVTIVGSAAWHREANDIDMSALVSSRGLAAEVESKFARFAQGQAELEALHALGPFVGIDFHAFWGDFQPGPRGWTSGPDEFELELGNEIAYSVPLWERGPRLAQLRERWVPFYDDELRGTRLAEARMYASNDLEHVPLMVKRKEPFHAFHRLYLAFQGFLQALFIARRTYPLSYDKWIRDQVEGLLGLADLYAELPAIIGVDRLHLETITISAERLGELLGEFTKP